MTKIFCPECGSRNAGERKYCSKCGTLLPEDETGIDITIRYSAEAEDREAETSGSQRETLEEGVHLFVRSGGDMAGTIFTPIDSKTTIGRQQDSDIFLDDITVSRQHAMLLHREDGYYIQDQGSLNGTYVNRVRVETQKLVDGDLTGAGEYITEEDLEGADTRGVERLLLKTRNSQLWAQPEFIKDYVPLCSDAASYLVETGVRLVGIDYLSIEQFKSDRHPVHHGLLGAGVIILEGVDLSEVPAGEYFLTCLPLRIVDGDGAPARAVLTRD